MKYGTLERPCIQTGQDLQAAIESLAEMPIWLEALLSGIGETQLRFKPTADTFSMIENICHLRDIEVEGYTRRLRRTLSEEMPVLPDIDGTRLGVERRYNEQPLAPALAEFTASRRENLNLLRGITPRDLSRKVQMETVGVITLAQLVEMWRDHDASHRAELAELRKLVQAL